MKSLYKPDMKPFNDRQNLFNIVPNPSGNCNPIYFINYFIILEKQGTRSISAPPKSFSGSIFLQVFKTFDFY